LLSVDTLSFKTDSISCANPKWKELALNGIIDKDGHIANIGVQLSGLGTLNIDDFKFFVENNNSWEQIAVANNGFEKIKGSSSEIKDWTAFASKFDYILDSIKSSEGKYSLQLSCLNNSKLFNESPSASYRQKERIFEGLFIQFPLVLFSFQGHTQPYAGKKSEEEFKMEMSKTLGDVKEMDPYMLLTDLINVWNIIKHFYPYNDEIPLESWDSRLTEYIEKMHLVKTEAQYKNMLLTFLMPTQDGHVFLYKDLEEIFGIPLKIDLIDGKFVVKQIIKGRMDADLKLGDVVLRINDTPSHKYFNEIVGTILGSPQYKEESALQSFFKGPFDSEVKLTVSNGLDSSVTRDIYFRRESIFVEDFDSTPKNLPDDVVYVNLSNTIISEDYLKDHNYFDGKKVIVDVRGHPIDDPLPLLKHLLKENDATEWGYKPKIIYPDYKNVTYLTSGWSLKYELPHINAKVVFLSDASSISASESILSFAKYYKLGKIIGAATAGANGNVRKIELLSGFKFMMSGLKIMGLDGSKQQGIGILPDIIVKKDYHDIKNGRDRVLISALDYLNKK